MVGYPFVKLMTIATELASPNLTLKLHNDGKKIFNGHSMAKLENLISSQGAIFQRLWASCFNPEILSFADIPWSITTR